MPEVLADGEAVAQAIVNLLENAVKYSSDDRFLAVRVWSNETSVVIEMEDHGLGIPPEHREHVFGRFYRAGSRTGRGGYGLGLYLVKHLMEAHRGRAEVTGEIGKGSIFALVFPRSPAVDAAGVA